MTKNERAQPTQAPSEDKGQSKLRNRALLTLAALAVIGGGLAVPAYADDDDHERGSRAEMAAVDPANVLPIEEILGKVKAAGYQNIREIKRKRGAYVVKAENAEGDRARIILNAETGEVVEQKTRKKDCG